MNTQRAYNKRMEQLNLNGNKKQRRKKYAHIIKEMGIRNITLEDIASGLGDKEKGFLDMMNKTGMTMDETVVLQQYAKAIIHQDTRSAEFLRDTVGEKPSTQIDVSGDENGLSKMSLEELKELKAALVELANKKED